MGGYDLSFVNLGIRIQNMINHIDIFGFRIAFYGIIIGIGILLGLQLAIQDAKRRGENPDIYIDFAIYGIVSAILVFIILINTNLDCRIYINKIHFYKKYIKEIFRLGLPIGVQSVLYPISNTIIQSSINIFGVNSIAAWAVSGKLDFLIWTISDAFSITVSTFVAQNYGAEKHQRARDGIKAALLMVMVVIFIISFILYFYSQPLSYFLISDKDIVNLTSKILKLIAPLYFIYVIGDVLSGAIRGIGDTFNPMIINIFGICVCRILWVFFVVPLNPTFFMVLCGFIVSWIITTLMYTVYVIYKRKSF